MGLNEFAIKLLLIFFPGIICAYVVDLLTVHRQRETTFFLLQSFIFGIFSYALYWMGIKILACFMPNHFSGSVTFLLSLVDSKTPFSFREIWIVTFISIGLACAVTLINKYRLLHVIARKVRLTNKFGDIDVWGYMLNMKEIVWVTVRDHSNNLIYDGWVVAFSEDSKNAELLLGDVSVYNNDNGERLYQVGTVYIARACENISIECRTLPISDKVLWKEGINEQPKGTTETQPGTEAPI